MPGHKTRRVSRRRRRARVIYGALMAFFILLLALSAGMLLSRAIRDRDACRGFAALQTLTQPSPDAQAAAQRDFSALLAQNGDIIGWITIPDTGIDYPVMYAPDRKDYYLKHDFYGEYSDYGVPYLDEDCTLRADARSDNLILYGHHMKTGLMFSELIGYREADFLAEHPRIHLDTLYDSAEYEVFAAFAIDVVQDTSFLYNTYIDMDQARYEEFVGEAIARSAVDTGIRPAFGEELLTLSTCEYSTANGRFVVCARRVPAGPAS